jgi:hypothetical protein
VIIRDYTPHEYSYKPVDGAPQVKQADYDTVDVIPVSDPNSATMAQKVVQYQAVIQMAQQAPQIYDLPFLHRQMLDILGVKDAAKLVPMTDDEKPTDPVSENMAIMNGKPVKAFIFQDHDAHLTVHMSAAQDPVLMQAMGQNPKAPMIMGAAQAHIMEHIAFKYRKSIEDAAGVPYPAPDQQMDKETEAEISRLAAAAAVQVLQTNQQQVQNQQNQQTAQDPIVQMQQAELQIKQQESQLKAQKLAIDATARQDQLDIERERIASQERIAGMQIGAKIGADKMRNSAQQQVEGLRIGVDVAKTMQQQEHQTKQKFADHTHQKDSAVLQHMIQQVQQQAQAQQAPQAPPEAPQAPTEEAPE